MNPRAWAVLAGVGLAACGACRKGRDAAEGDAGDLAAKAASSAVFSSPSPSASEPGAPGAPQKGMAWIPPGTLRAGTPRGRIPRVPDEEMAGDAVEMGGFYIDLLPYPNEPGAIPTSNVTRDEAEQLCASKGKRLCTELEWERACKGPDSSPYEYGETYREAACGTGVAIEQAARRPSGEHAQCKSGFGAADMHGGVWEWTSSPWGRGSKDTSLGVLRGGNAGVGELVGRCANAIGRPVGKKSPTLGLRCCSGPKNTSEVTLPLTGTPGLVSLRDAASLKATWDGLVDQTIAGGRIARAWTWTPVANEELVVLAACAHAKCSVLVGRVFDDKPAVLAATDMGGDQPLPDVARIGDAKHLRAKGTLTKGVFGREITYVYGRVEIADTKRN